MKNISSLKINFLKNISFGNKCLKGLLIEYCMACLLGLAIGNGVTDLS